MRLIIQRVTEASVTVEERVVARCWGLEFLQMKMAKQILI